MLFGWWLASLVCNVNNPDDTGFFDSELNCFGDIRAETPEIDFGQVDVGDVASATIWVTNESNCAAPIESVSLDVNDGSFYVHPVTASMIPAFDAVMIDVDFTPFAPGAWADFVTLSFGGEFPTEVDIELYGEALAGAVEIDTNTLDFEAVALGCEGTLPVTVTNVGNATLTLSELNLDGEEFTVETEWGDPLPLTLRAGASEALLVRYTPVDEGADLGTLDIVTSDLDQPLLSVALSGSAYAASTTSETFTQSANGASDILLAVSTTAAMETYNRHLDIAFESFITELIDTGSSYHVAVVTQADGCIAGPVTVVDPTMNPRYASAILSAMLYAGDEVPSTALSPLEMLRLALDPVNTEVGGCNADFYRPDATLALVGVINGPDQSPLDWSDYVTGYQALKADSSDLVLHGIGGPYPNGCGAVPPSEGLADAVIALGGEMFAICEADLAPTLTRIASVSVADLRRFTLSEEPIPSTIEVVVDDEVREDWSFDAITNAIVFPTDAAPPDGATVVIRYAPAATCE